MIQVMYGHQSLNTEYLKAFTEHWVKNVCPSAQQGKVIPLLTIPRSPKALAWHAAVNRLLSNGYIPRMYAFFERAPHQSPDELILKLKDMPDLKNVDYSVSSFRPGRTLVLCSYSKETPDGKDSNDDHWNGPEAS